MVVCDEIVSGLDVSVRERRGIGLRFVGHDLRVVPCLCGRVAVTYLTSTLVASAPD